MELTDEQWSVLEPLIGEMPRRADGRGRPWRSSREVLNGILWILVYVQGCVGFGDSPRLFCGRGGDR